MKLSIFPKAKAHPSSKEEKRSNSFFVSKPYKPSIVEVNTESDLADIVCSSTWSPFVFREFRLEDDFISTDVIAFDIDNGTTLEQAEETIHKLDISCLTLPSVSHTPENHRFRLIFPLSRTIRDKETYRTTYAKLSESFSVDPSCKDLARFYYASRAEHGFWYESKLLEPTEAPQKPVNSPKAAYDASDRVMVGESLEELVVALYGEKRERIPESVHYFLENAADGLSGEMFTKGNAFLFTCALQGCEQERVEDVFYSLYPYDVTNKVEYMVDKILNEGYNSREPDEE